jgi:hypothetical protein
MQVTLASKIRLHVPNVARQMIKRIIWRAKPNAPNPTSPVSNEIQKDMVIFRGMSFVGC